jgi:hypothetical protein
MDAVYSYETLVPCHNPEAYSRKLHLLQNIISQNIFFL